MDGKLYQDPADCRVYIYCSGGYAYRAHCDEGLYYDHKLWACNYDNGQCAGLVFSEVYQLENLPDEKPFISLKNRTIMEQQPEDCISSSDIH